MSTGEKVSVEMLSNALAFHQLRLHGLDRVEPANFEDRQMVEMDREFHSEHVAIITELQRLRSSSEDAKGRWVPWKPGDALPATAPVLHWTTWFDKEYIDEPTMRANYAHDFERWGVTAYWSIPLPHSYSAMSQETP